MNRRMVVNKVNNQMENIDPFLNWPLRKLTCPGCGGLFETRDLRKIYCSRRCKRRTSDRRVKDRETRTRLEVHLAAARLTALTDHLMKHPEALPRADDEQNPFAMLDKILGQGQGQAKPDQP